MMQRRILVVIALVVMAGLSMQISDAWARAGGGGSRGSRSYSSPARPSPMSPSNPSTPSTRSPSTSPTMGQRPGMFGGGLMSGIAGFALGGLLGSMLFGGLGGAGFGGGIGMLDLLLIGGGLFLLYRFMKNRRESQQPAYATGGAAYGAGERMTGAGGTATMEMPAGLSDLDRGVEHIRQMDPAFDVAAVAQFGRDTFTGVQGAVMANNMAPVAGRLTSRMYTELQNQCDRLRAQRQTNRLERIDVQRAEVTEAWQESGQDYVTVYLEGSLLDYTVDDGTGRVVAGSNTVADPFREFWTFVRPVGPTPWKLSAIQLG